MIKKLLLTTCVASAGMTMAHGQAIVLDNGLLSRNPVKTFSMPNVQKAPMKALGENEMYMGPYVSDALSDGGLGLTSYSGNFKICAFLPKDLVDEFNGGTVKRIRFGVCASITNAAVYLIPVTSLSPFTVGEPVIEQSVSSTKAGWNEVTINNPYIIDTEGTVGFLLGYQYRQISGSSSSCYPISAVMEGTIYNTYMYGIGGSTQWQDIGLSSYGNLSVQAVVENENFPQYNLLLNSLIGDSYADVAKDLKYILTMSNMGIGTLTDYHIDVLIDDQKVDELDSPVNLTQTPVNYTGTISLNGLTSGSHTLTLRATDAAGEVVTGQEVSHQFFAYSNGYPRQKQLIEHFTSQYCTYCYLGVYVLEALSNLRGDLAWVSIHGNMTSGNDIFTTNEGNQIMSYLSCTGFPSASFNRYDFEMSGELTTGLGYNVSYTQQAAQMLSEEALDANPTPSLASIDLTATYNPETRQLDVTVAGDASPDFNTVFGNKVAITVYLTEDSLVARQLSNGSWNQNYIHNHVMRDIISKNYYGDAINWTGETTYSNTFSTTLNDTWNSDNMHVVAFINRIGTATQREVINAEIINIKDLVNFERGDVNGDKLIDIEDVNAVINIILKVKTEDDYPGNANINNDDTVDVDDMNLIINIILNQNN